MFRVRKKDKVRILSGKYKDKEGEVLEVFPRQGKILVSGVNFIKRHLKKREGVTGGIVSVEKPLDASKVAVICKNCQKSTAVSFKRENGKKLRVCRECQGQL